MKQYIDKAAAIAEIKKLETALRNACKPNLFGSIEECVTAAELEALNVVKRTIDTLEIKEVKENNVWHDARKVLPEDSTNQIICIKEDGLALVTIGKIVNNTTKWAYLNDLKE